jgi:hypothetical protein
MSTGGPPKDHAKAQVKGHISSFGTAQAEVADRID